MVFTGRRQVSNPSADRPRWPSHPGVVHTSTCMQAARRARGTPPRTPRTEDSEARSSISQPQRRPSREAALMRSTPPRPRGGETALDGHTTHPPSLATRWPSQPRSVVAPVMRTVVTALKLSARHRADNAEGPGPGIERGTEPVPQKPPTGANDAGQPPNLPSSRPCPDQGLTQCRPAWHRAFLPPPVDPPPAASRLRRRRPTSPHQARTLLLTRLPSLPSDHPTRQANLHEPWGRVRV